MASVTRRLISSGDFFNRPRHVTGRVLQWGFTNNALVHRKTLVQGFFLFNPLYGLSGGSDSELFFRLHTSGARMVWCDEALVHEQVLHNRMTLGWLVKRAFRGGQSFARIHVAGMSPLRKTRWMVRRILLISVAVAGLSLWLIRSHWGIFALRKVASNIGQLCWNSSRVFKEYQHIHG